MKSGAQPRYIEVSELEKRYGAPGGSTQALAPTSFAVEEGEFISFVGPSGCGKSTMLMLVSGLLPATSGQVRVGNGLVEGPITELGIVFQQDLLMEWRRVLSNILVQGEFRGIPKKKLRPRALELLGMVGLQDFANVYPQQLSGGMRQRVAICRALVHDPPLLLMDEPFGSVDAITRDQMALDLQSIWYGMRKTVIFITHSISEAIFLSDRVLVLGPRPGRLVDEVRVDLPRPRHLEMRETPEFGLLAKRIRAQLEAMGALRSAWAWGSTGPSGEGEHE